MANQSEKLARRAVIKRTGFGMLVLGSVLGVGNLIGQVTADTPGENYVEDLVDYNDDAFTSTKPIRLPRSLIVRTRENPTTSSWQADLEHARTSTGRHPGSQNPEANAAIACSVVALNAKAHPITDASREGWVSYHDLRQQEDIPDEQIEAAAVHAGATCMKDVADLLAAHPATMLVAPSPS